MCIYICIYMWCVCFVLWTSSFLITHVHFYMHVYFHTQTFFLMRTHRAASRLHLPRKSRARRDPRPPSVTRLRCNTYCFCLFLSVWAKGSSNSGGLLYIFTASHLHFHIYTDHLHIFTSSHLHIFTHLLSLSFSLLHIFSSSHLLSPSLHLSLSRSLSLSLSLSHSLALSLSLSLPLPLSLSLSRPLALCHSLSPSFSFLSWGRGRCRRGATKWLPFGTKWGSIVKNCEVKLRFYILRGNPFARNEVRMSKTEVKLRLWRFHGNPFARNEVRSSKTAK